MSWLQRNAIWSVLGAIIIGSALVGFLYPHIINPPKNIPNDDDDLYIYDPPTNDDNSTLEEPESVTTPEITGKITVEGVGTFYFEPANITSIRPDLFNPNFFSLFDILVYLDNTSQIEMDYSFNTSMNTYVIHSIDGLVNIWYKAYYSGGWWERNVFRMDHYPYKDETTTIFYSEDLNIIAGKYRAFMEEIVRKNTNNGTIILPSVTIRGPPTEGSLEFFNVSVTAHNLRNDVFREGVITAIDTILSLVDQGEIQAGLQWYEEIGTAEIVKSYWVEMINDWLAHDTCGFVYEAGDDSFEFFQGNHIHIPSDSRIINSPEYVLYFWICL